MRSAQQQGVLGCGDVLVGLVGAGLKVKPGRGALDVCARCVPCPVWRVR